MLTSHIMTENGKMIREMERACKVMLTSQFIKENGKKVSGFKGL